MPRKQKYAQGIYTIKNPHKYVGKGKPMYRSGWELTFMIFCDTNDKILKWASESIVIPYLHPFKGKRTNYIPDFFIVYQDKFGKTNAEMKAPKFKDFITEKVQNARQQAVVAINHAKWYSAKAYCKAQGMAFRVITEHQIFNKPQRSKRKKK